MAGDPGFKMANSTLRQSNNYQGIVGHLQRRVVRSGMPGSCCRSIDRNQTLSGMLLFSDLESSLDFTGQISL